MAPDSLLHMSITIQWDQTIMKQHQNTLLFQNSKRNKDLGLKPLFHCYCATDKK